MLGNSYGRQVFLAGCRARWHAVTGDRTAGIEPTARHGVRGLDPSGHKACRSPSRAADQVELVINMEDRQGPRPDDPPVGPATGGSGDRVSDVPPRHRGLALAGGEVE